MKLLDIITTANHNLMRNKTRTILTILAIFIGSFCIVTTSASQAGINKFLDDQTSAFVGLPVKDEPMLIAETPLLSSLLAYI